MQYIHNYTTTVRAVYAASKNRGQHSDPEKLLFIKQAHLVIEVIEALNPMYT